VVSENVVTFRRQVSDGAYGSETIEVQLAVEDPLPQETAGVLRHARQLVEEELARSPNAHIRHTMARERS
jgi:hypothetical protein